MSNVRKRKGETIEELLERFKRAVKKDGRLKEYQNHKYFQSDSERERKRQAENSKKNRRNRS